MAKQKTPEATKTCAVCGIDKPAKAFRINPYVMPEGWTCRTKTKRTLDNTRTDCMVCRGNGRTPELVQASTRKW